MKIDRLRRGILNRLEDWDQDDTEGLEKMHSWSLESARFITSLSSLNTSELLLPFISSCNEIGDEHTCTNNDPMLDVNLAAK